MAFFIVYDTATELVARFEEHPDGGAPVPGAGYGVLPVAARMTPARGDRVVGGAYSPYVPTQGDAVAAKVLAATAYYDALIGAGFSHAGVPFQVDPESQSRIAAMSAMALGSIADPANSPWPTDFYWVAADNSHAPMDAAAMYGFGRSVAAYVSACILRLRAIKDMIAAADPTALGAIDVTAGYPTAAS